ncbi:MAG: 50S ribosomal protein L18 [Bacteroidales bacterium]|jgi:large subunit ribosomal protein L18|nr:50S ribosomal protein L18 [Bacteroidales bacterium]MBP7037579.1 50S ribosomal protein L18 [Bacteroidales bacterium]MDI9552943.1 50S ribosomal protein L18 [Bacteroidota bacterium]MZP64576.1 50S ribosomal protein L18 [Bacteroidales bacterium]NLK55299.1 50S ribosomal protein L18 [Bacteroidales bacterium]
MALTKLEKRNRIRMRIRKKISGTAEKPRIAVFRSNKQIYAQVVDDIKGITILSVSSREKEVAGQTGIKKTEQAKLVGKSLAEKCKEKGIENVVFDRSGYKYHGRVKSLAEAAREGGLKF